MELSNVLQHWFAQHKRELPWRETSDPYRIWVSEIILQQTRVAQGLDYYRRFVERFPSVQDLAEATETEVLRLWQGLGYYSRARNMLKAARQCQGCFPSHYEDLIQLPGIGDYTAAAVSSFSAGEPHATVDGNVYRVLARWFDLDTPTDTPAGNRLFKQLATEVMDQRHPGAHNQAVMEFGALQCTPGQPDCSRCPVQDGCLAYAHGTVNQRPVKAGKTRQRIRHLYYMDIRMGEDTFLHRRSGRDIWQGLYEMPLWEQETEPSDAQIERRLHGTGYALGGWSREIRHVLSHQVLLVRFLPVNLLQTNEWLDRFIRVPVAELDRYPLSRLTLNYLENKKG
ncbi:MAG: A/G-specific adenine glycosylase [Paludibacteraceae bacterium]|nr:A/G-specific adenine glycosylase [Paludibacteraceae bacterium]